jgi:hypothetical protein
MAAMQSSILENCTIMTSVTFNVPMAPARFWRSLIMNWTKSGRLLVTEQERLETRVALLLKVQSGTFFGMTTCAGYRAQTTNTTQTATVLFAKITKSTPSGKLLPYIPQCPAQHGSRILYPSEVACRRSTHLLIVSTSHRNYQTREGRSNPCYMPRTPPQPFSWPFCILSRALLTALLNLVPIVL